MAERRMFAKTIIDSDAFIDMPVTARLLYYDLSMRADDDGFVNSPKKIMRMIGASQDDLSILIMRKFIIPFDSGVVVIKHWRIHNYIRKDMYHETKYKEEKEQLELDENNAYVSNMSQPCNEPVTSPSTQVRLGKDRLGKDRIEERKNSSFSPARHRYGEYNNVLLSDEELEKLKAELPDSWEQYIQDLSSYMASTGKSYKSHLATIRNWARKDKGRRQPQTQPKKETEAERISREQDEMLIAFFEKEKGDGNGGH